MTSIYKILPHRAWDEAQAAGVYLGSAADLKDGFIHMSFADQLQGTLKRHFAGEADLVLVRFDTASFGDELKFEPSRAGALFPHVYGPLDATCARGVSPLPKSADGVVMLPDDVNPEGAKV